MPLIDYRNFGRVGPALGRFGNLPGTPAGPDVTPPTISVLSPLDNATGVLVGANFTATFSENVVFDATVSITLKKTSDNSTIQAFTEADIAGAISISGAVLTINPTADLANSTEYYILIDATSVKDAAGNFFAGIASTTAWSFTTVASGGAFQGAGDIVSGATMWCSQSRAYTAAFAAGLGPIADFTDAATGTDNFTMNILATGFADVASLVAHYGATPIRCKKLYDQTGNGNHLIVSATLTQNPTVTLSMLNGLPSVKYDRTVPQRMFTNAGLSSTINQPFFESFVFQRFSGADFGPIIDIGGTNRSYTAAAANTMQWGSSGTNFNVTASDAAFHAVNGTYDGASSVVMVDGTDTTGNAGATAASGIVSVGNSGPFSSNIHLMEMGIWSGTGNRSGLNSNQHGASGYNF